MPGTIAVFGSSSVSQSHALAERAVMLGEALARAGFAVISGGYMGVMEAASRGAREAGGEVIGVTCKVFSRRGPNPYLTEERCCDTLLERIATLMRDADGYVVLGGNIGTLAELFLAWNLIATGWDKPLVLVGEELRLALSALREYTEISDKQLRLLILAPDVSDAVEALCDRFGSAQGPGSRGEA